mgnify:CR=1 FL=1
MAFFGVQTTSFGFLTLVILSLLMGIVLNYTMFLCTAVNSALTTTIVGVLKGVGTTVSVTLCDSLVWVRLHIGNNMKILKS